MSGIDPAAGVNRAPAPGFHPREAAPSSPACPTSVARAELLDRIVERVHRDLPRATGLAVAQAHSPRAGLVVLASRGCGRDFVEAQGRVHQGPVIAAVEHQVPVLSPDLGADDRWPLLTRHVGEDQVWSRVRGAAAAPGAWQADDTVVLCAALDTVADAGTMMTLIGYEQLIAAAMVTAAAREGDDTADMLAVLQSRGAIEQAKGVIMGLLRCDAGTAWTVLRRASHESNVKLRVLAVALVEHVGGAPAEQPSAESPIVAGEPARRAARLLWEVLSRSPKPPG